MSSLLPRSCVMLIDKIDPGFKTNGVVKMIVEVPAMHQPVKYEIDKDSGAIEVDRFLGTPMFYPCHYGFVPNTLADDGDPLDMLLWCSYDLAPGVLIEVRVIGVLDMEDEGGQDSKVVAVPSDKISPLYSHIKELSDLPEASLAQIKHFFEHYKDLEKNKWVKVREFHGRDHAISLVQKSLDSISDK